MRAQPLGLALAVLISLSAIADIEPRGTIPESPMLAAVARAVDAGDAAAADRFWAQLPEHRSPLIERIPGDAMHVRATFLWRAGDETKDVVLLAQPDGVAMFRDPRSHLVRLASTDIWYRTHTLPADAEFSYAYSVNPPVTPSDGAMLASFHPDPLNPLQYRILDGPVRSIARMPGVPQNPWIEDTRAPKGRFEQRTVASVRLKTGRERSVWIYQTPGELRAPNILILLDGTTYAKSVPTPRILDNLFAAGKVGPTLALLLADGSGDAWRTDLYFSDDFIAFLSDDLLPWVAREYHLSIDPARTTIGGDSIAGLTAGFAALRRPDVFRHVIAQSGSFWLNNRDLDNGEPEWLGRQFMHAPASGATFWIDVGQMEIVANEGDRVFPPFVPGSTSLLAANRHLRDVLQMKGYAVRYVEDYGAHEPLRWTRDFPQALITTIGGR